jgi:oxygen-independent coproporphyrinogen III oxidase
MPDQSIPIQSLYVHVPFCAHKCEYCAFFSQAPSGEVVNRYVDALARELELVAPSVKLGTVFFGGGTPSLLNLAQWRKILETMERCGLLGAREWTVECNPATVSLDKARLLREFGVNRISMGVQSLDENLLERLGRIHTREMVFKSYDNLRRAGFENINLDLMFGIPGQTMAIWRETLREITAIGSEHLSCYEVIYEEDTPLFDQLQAGQFRVEDELAADMYEELIRFAGEKGFHQYEIANFARHFSGGIPEIPDRACAHNVNYWRGGSFVGAGPSASGYENGARTRNWANTTLYCEQLEKGRRAIEFREELSPLARAGEIAAFGLRMNAGWPFAAFEETTGFDLQRGWREEMERMILEGYARKDSARFQLTGKGLRFADWVAEQFLRPDGEGAISISAPPEFQLSSPLQKLTQIH